MREVAEQIGVSLSTYRDWEYGRKIPLTAAQQLVSVFGKEATQLLGFKNTKSELKEIVLLFEEAQRRLYKFWTEQEFL